MAALPDRADIAGTPSNATAKAGFGALWDYLSGLFGATGTVADARTALAVPSKGEIQAQTLTAYATGGTGSAFTLTPVPALTAYADKQRFVAVLSADPSGSPTMNWNALGAKNFKYYDSNGSKQFVTTGQAKSGYPCDVMYDGTDIVLLNPLPSGVSLTGDQTISGVKTFTSQPIVPAQSMVRLNTSNGYGSTNTKIRRFTTVVKNQGSDITYADSATLGGSFTINTAGVYSVSYSEVGTAGMYAGLSLNTAGPTTGVQSLTRSEILSFGNPGGNAPQCIPWTGYLAAGDVVRAHTDGTTDGTPANGQQFTICRVG